MPQLSPEVIRILKESIPPEEESKSLVEQILSEPTEEELKQKEEEDSSIWKDIVKSFTEDLPRGTKRLIETRGMQTLAPAAMGFGTTRARKEKPLYSSLGNMEGFGDLTMPAISTKKAAEMTASSPLYNWGVKKYTDLQIQLKENPELLRPKEIADLPYWHPRVIATAIGDAVPSLIEVMVPTLAAGAVGGPAAAYPVLITTTFGLEYGGVIDTAMEMGLTPDEAINTAVLVGTINAAIGIIPGTRAMKAMGLMSKKTNTRLIREIIDRGLHKNIKKEALTQGIFEIGEELAQESVNMAGEVYGLGASIELDEAVRRYYEVTVGAGAIGGSTGAVTGSIGYKSAEKTSNTVEFAAQEITEDVANDLQVSMVEGESTIEIWPESKFKETAYKPEQFEKIGENENGEAIYAVQVQGANTSEGGISISQTADRSTILEEVVEYRLKNLGENQGTLIERIQNWATTLRQIAEENNIPIRFENTVNGNIELFSDAMVYHYGGYGELNPESAAITYIPPDIAEDFIGQMGEMSDGTRVFDYLKGTSQEVDSPAFIRQQVDEGMQQEFDGETQERAPPGETNQMVAPTEAINNKSFKRWFKDSRVVDSEGNPTIVYHGTLSDIQEFNLDRANPESDAGMGYYFTSNPEDASDNYGRPEGPDITQRVELLAEREENYGKDDETDDAIRTKIRNELADNEGAVMPVFLSMKNPATSNTYLEPMEEYVEEIEDYDVNEESDAYMMYESIPIISRDFNDIDWAEVQGTFAELAMDEPNAIQLFDAFKKSEPVAYITDEDGNLASGEFVRRVFEEGGFDGLIFDKADQRFNMNMPDDVTHYIAFKPNQIKSAFNLGTFDPDTDDISFQITKPTWFSKTEQIIEEKFPPKMKFQSVKNELLKKYQIPKAEYDWLDIDHFIDTYKNKTDKNRVNKEDLLEWIRANRIEVKDNFYKKNEQEIIAKNLTSEQVINSYFKDKDGKTTLSEDDEKMIKEEYYMNHSIVKDSESGRLSWIFFDTDQGGYNAARLGENEYVEGYTSGGGYLVDSAIAFGYTFRGITFDEAVTAVKLSNKKRSQYEDYTLKGPKKDYQELILTWNEQTPPKYSIREKPNNSFPNKNDYTVVGTITWNHPTLGKDSEIILGTWPNKALAESEIQFEQLSNENRNQIEQYGYQSPHYNDVNNLAHVRYNTRTSIDGKRVLFLEEIQSDWDSDLKKGDTKKDMPYKDNTWVALVLKRMVRYAAENNFDSIAWTTPRQQLERNQGGLRSTVDAISYQKVPDLVEKRPIKIGRKPSVKINGIKNKQSVVNVTVPLEGRTTINGTKITLDGLVGKKIATQIRESEKKVGSIEGDNLSLGEQGYINLYEYTIKKRLKALSKKLGWKAEIKDIYLPKKEIFEDMAKEGLYLNKENQLKQPSIEITPEMKMSAMDGMPTFQLTKPQDVPGWVYNDAGKNAGKPKFVKKDISSWWNTNIIPLSQRLRRIDESLVAPIRMVDYKVFTQTEDNIQTVKPFLDTMKEIRRENVEDYSIIDLAMKNGDAKVLESLFKRYKSKRLRQKYLLVRAVLDDIYIRAENAGMDMGFIDEYFPRQVSDYEGLIKYFYGNFDKGVLDKEVAVKEKDLGRKLSMEEKTDLISARLRGFGKKISNKPGATKKRTQQFITSEMNELFYHSLEHSITQYISTMNNTIESSIFFGGTKTKGEISDRMIGKKVAELMDNKNISPAQQAELMQVIKARFNTSHTSQFVRFLKTMGYLGTMTQLSSAITQFGDLAWAAYLAPKETPGALLKAARGKSKIKKEDLGIDKISYEFKDDLGIAENLLNNTFKAIGLSWMDGLGKNTLINAVIKKYQRKAKAGKLEGDRRLNEAFGSDVNKVIGDLKRGVITERVKFLAFYTLADFQPISYTELPEGATTGNYSKVFYMLRTFTIKQFDAFRTESINLIKKGKRTNNQKMVNEGVANMVKLAATFALANASADALKDLIHGRKINVTDYVIDNILRLFGMSRYMAYHIRRFGPVQGFTSAQTPPVSTLLAAPIQDTADYIKSNSEGNNFNWNELQTIKVIPVVGKLYYWWFGKGRDYELEDRAKKGEDNKDLKSFLGLSDKTVKEEYHSRLDEAKEKGWISKKTRKKKKRAFTKKLKKGKNPEPWYMDFVD